MYQALYRKYRPKNFDDVVGQDVIIRTLKNSVEQNKISHAYLMSGPRGSGKTSIAKILARTVNCLEPINCMPCDKCVFCTQNNDQSMDIIEIDAASNNGVDEIREINNKVNLVPSLGKYKIYIIDEVHMLTIGAFNALLKTLEEPPAHVIFILATTDPQKVPITILSRCQRFDFKKISESCIYDRIKFITECEDIQIEENAIKEISRLGDGSLRDAISILDQVFAYSIDKITIDDIHEVNGTISQEVLLNLITKIVNVDVPGVITILDDYSNGGKSIIKITEEIILFFRNVLLNQYNINKSDTYSKIGESIQADKILNCIQVINQSLSDMRKFSNPKLILEITLIKLMDLMGNKNTPEIKEKENNIKTETKHDDNNVKIKTELIVNNGEKTSVKESKPIISREMKSDDKLIEDFKKFVDVRVKNTLSNLSKKTVINVKEKLRNLEEYIFDEKYGPTSTMILDGLLKAASDEYLVFVYKTEHLSYIFNESIPMIEELLGNILDNNYRVVAVSSEQWDEIKEEYNSKKIKYDVVDETVEIKDLLNRINASEKDGMEFLFGELVEYN